MPVVLALRGWRNVASPVADTSHASTSSTMVSTPIDSDDMATPEPRNVLLFKEWLLSHGGSFHPGVRYSRSSSSGRCNCNQILARSGGQRDTTSTHNVTSVPSPRVSYRIFDRCERGHNRTRRDHRDLPRLDSHHPASGQECSTAYTSTRSRWLVVGVCSYDGALVRTTIDHRLCLLSLDCKPRDVKSPPFFFPLLSLLESTPK